MAEHENSIGESDEWYTPKYIFDQLDITFDLDVASPSYDHWVPALKVYTQVEDGLVSPWTGTVWMNPPFGGRNGQVPWLEKFIRHGDGIGLVAARTSAGRFHDCIPRMDAIFFPRGKTKFVKPDGTVGKSPGTGIVIFAKGERGVKALRNLKDGMFIELNNTNITKES